MQVLGQMIDFYRGKVAKWWIPDDGVFVDTLPTTTTGKVQKLVLRHAYAGRYTPDALSQESQEHA